MDEEGTDMMKMIRSVLPKFSKVGRRLTREEVLEQPKRREVFTYIMSNPGASFPQIREALKWQDPNDVLLHWHLGILKKFDYIAQKSDRYYICRNF